MNGHIIETFLSCSEHDTTEFFKSIGINNTVHHQAIIDHFMALAGQSVHAAEDTLQRCPREILRDMFKLQSVHLDPDDINTAMNKVMGYRTVHPSSPFRLILVFCPFLPVDHSRNGSTRRRWCEYFRLFYLIQSCDR